MDISENLMKSTTIISTLVIATFAVTIKADMMPERSYEPPPWQSGATTVSVNRDDGTLRVSGNGPMEDYDVYDRWRSGNRAPWHIPGVLSRVIAAAAPITAVIIEEGVTHIGAWAFLAEDELRSITIPASVTSIGKNAFWDNRKLTSITVNTDNAHYCSADSVLFNKDKTILILYPGGRKDSAYTIPNGVTIIGRNAFHGAHELKSVTIPNSVTSIKKRGVFLLPGANVNNYPRKRKDHRRERLR